MKVMAKYSTIFLLWRLALVCCIALLLGLSSCQRRELDREYIKGLPIQINVDWSRLNPEDEKPQYIKVLFFNEEGGDYMERYIDPDGELVRVPEGSYRIILYQWRVNGPSQALLFRGDRHETFEVYTPFFIREFDTKATAVQILKQPEQHYSWTSMSDVVTIQGYTPNEATIINTLPTANVKLFKLPMRVSNIRYAKNFDVLITGSSNSMRLGYEETTQGPHPMSGSLEMIEAKPDISKLLCTITSFGFMPDRPYKFYVIVTLVNDTIQAFEFDVTDYINGDSECPDIFIDIDISGITIGDGEGFKPPTVNGWDEIETTVPF